MSDSTSNPGDRRDASRQRTLLGGIVIHGPAALTIDCTIRDLSDTGARVRLSGPEALAKPLVLLAHSVDRAYEAQVSWHRNGETGMTFLRPLDLNAPDTDLARTARRLWLERRRR